MTTNTEQLQILEKLFAEHFFCRTLRADFFTFQLIYKSFESVSILFWHPTAKQVSYIACCLLSRWKRLVSEYVYIWLPRNSACVLKHKQTWPEQAVYRNHVQALLQEFFPQKSFLWASASAFLRPCYCVSCYLMPVLLVNFIFS